MAEKSRCPQKLYGYKMVEKSVCTVLSEVQRDLAKVENAISVVSGTKDTEEWIKEIDVSKIRADLENVIQSVCGN